MGKALERWQLHKRVALWTILRMGEKPGHQIAGFMLITGFFSLWISNTATTVMMAPIAMSLIRLMEDHNEPHHEDYAKALLLSIAYSASIGGIGTIIGTPTNALLMAFLDENYQISISFAKWMSIGIPVVVVMLLLCWVWLTYFKFQLPSQLQSKTSQMIRQELDDIGPINKGEKWVGLVFVLTAMAWITRPLINAYLYLPISDAGIAVSAAILMFLIPVDREKSIMLMDWDTAVTIPWGTLLLFGGGLSLAALLQASGLAGWIALQLNVLSQLPTIALITMVVTVIIFLAEITSNVATIASFLPPLGALAIAVGVSPTILCIPATIAASCAFMMPVATAPNAIIFGFRRLSISDMMSAGLALNIMGIVAITGILYLERIL